MSIDNINTDKWPKELKLCVRTLLTDTFFHYSVYAGMISDNGSRRGSFQDSLIKKLGAEMLELIPMSTGAGVVIENAQRQYTEFAGEIELQIRQVGIANSREATELGKRI